MLNNYRKAYRQYCWQVDGVVDYKLAPFHILAHENSLNMGKDHGWHIAMIDKLCEAAPEFLQKTQYRVVNINDENDCQQASDWWLAMTQNGGEGIVVKPFDFTVLDNKGLVQPGIKCRGSEYLRIIYGPEYTRTKNLERLRKRGLGKKRNLALQEYALGYEALYRFVQREPLHKVHECVFAVLALESEPVDPRL